MFSSQEPFSLYQQGTDFLCGNLLLIHFFDRRMVSRYSSGQLLFNSPPPPTKKKPQEGNGQNFGDRETLVSRGKRTRREALLGKTKSSGTGVTTLDRNPDQSPGVEAYIHALGINGTRKEALLGETRSSGRWGWGWAGHHHSL